MLYREEIYRLCLSNYKKRDRDSLRLEHLALVRELENLKRFIKIQNFMEVLSTFLVLIGIGTVLTEGLENSSLWIGFIGGLILYIVRSREQRRSELPMQIVAINEAMTDKLHTWDEAYSEIQRLVHIPQNQGNSLSN